MTMMMTEEKRSLWGPPSLAGVSRTYKVVSHALPIVASYYSLMAELSEKRSATDDDEEYRSFRDLKLSERHEEMAPLIAAMYGDLGGVYLKAAQYACSQGTLLPAAWERQLQFAFEQATPRPWKDMVFVDKELFESINERALAAASVGQVHEARLKSGERVAVKIVYEDAKRHMKIDFANQRALLLYVDEFLKLNLKESIETILNEFEENFPKELDLTLEAKNSERARKTFELFHIKVPRVFYASSSVLVTEFVDGQTIANLKKDPTKVAPLLNLVDAIGASLFRDGFFHADAHPGNVIFMKRQRHTRRAPSSFSDDDDDSYEMALLDWGQCCELNAREIASVARLVVALNSRSRLLLSRVLETEEIRKNFDFGRLIDTDAKLALFFQFFDSSVPPFAKAAKKRMAYLLQHDAANCPTFSKIPPECIFFGRTVAALAKCLRTLDPHHDVSVANRWAPYARQVLQNLGDPNDLALLALPLNPNWTARLEKILSQMDTGKDSSLQKIFLSVATSDALHLELLPRIDAVLHAVAVCLTIARRAAVFAFPAAVFFFFLCRILRFLPPGVL